MPTLDTKRLSITSSEYTLIGEGVIALSFSENYVGQVKIVIRDTTLDAPLAGHADFILADREFEYSGTSANIYAMSTGADFAIGVLRQ